MPLLLAASHHSTPNPNSDTSLNPTLPPLRPRPRLAEEDRRERRRRLGLPEELTEEEKEAEREKAAAKAAQEAKRKLPIKPVASGLPVAGWLRLRWDCCGCAGGVGASLRGLASRAGRLAGLPVGQAGRWAS